MAKNKNNTKICGKNPKIANKPERTPSQTNPVNHWADSGKPDSIAPVNASIIAPKDISKKLNKITPGELIPASVQNNPSYIVPSREGATFANNPPKNKKFSANVKWKTTNKIVAKINKPQTLCVKTLSILSDLFILWAPSSLTSLFAFLIALEKFSEMYLYLLSAITASISSPKTSSLNVFLKSSTILIKSGCIFVSTSSFSTNLIAWNKGLEISLPSKAMRTSPIKWSKSLSERTVLPFLSFNDALYALDINSSRLSSFKALTSTHGTPNFSSRTLRFKTSPFLLRMSIILTATTTGTSISNNWVVK